jgi:hypothetical protein
LALGAWRLALGAWRLALGAWRLALGEQEGSCIRPALASHGEWNRQRMKTRRRAGEFSPK